MQKKLETCKTIARETLLLASIGSICYGLSLIYQPIAWIVGGLLMFLIVIPGKRAVK